MDQERFDRIARTLASGQSRRGVLKGLTGTAIGGLLAAVGIGEAVAAPPAGKPSKCYGDNSSCTNGKQCCSGTCTNRTCAPVIPVDRCAGVTCTATSECFTPGTCSGGVCSPQNPKDSGVSCSIGTCDGAGTCRAPEVCTGLPLNASCATADQCCPDGAAVACGPVGNLFQPECCRPLGAACAIPGEFSECCATLIRDDTGAVVNGRLVTCASGTCGGVGASCDTTFNTCAPGLVCNEDFSNPGGPQCALPGA